MTESPVAVLVRLAGPDVRAAVEPVNDDKGLIGAEIQAVANAIAKRRAEFAAGRRAARAALGNMNAVIPASKDRAPVWPAGYVGAITHDDGLAMAICARSERMAGLGVDLTEAAPFPEHLRDRVLTAASEQNLNGLEARAVFSAKETLYKTLYPQVRHFFGFEAASIAPDFTSDSFTATLTIDLATFAAGTKFRGGLAIIGDRMLTTLALRP